MNEPLTKCPDCGAAIPVGSENIDGLVSEEERKSGKLRKPTYQELWAYAWKTWKTAGACTTTPERINPEHFNKEGNKLFLHKPKNPRKAG